MISPPVFSAHVFTGALALIRRSEPTLSMCRTVMDAGVGARRGTFLMTAPRFTIHK